MTNPYAQQTLSERTGVQESRQRFPDFLTVAVFFLVFALVFSILRSRDIFAVDGAFRCLEVFRRGGIFFHDNNHMLYPVNVLLWTRLMSALGLTSNGPLQFFSNVELMNCTAAAGS